MKFKTFLAFLLLSALLITGCRASAAGESQRAAADPTSVSTPEPTATPAPAAAKSPEAAAAQPTNVAGADLAGEPVILFSQTGGIAGRSEEWKIYEDGTIINVNGTERQGDAQQVQEILGLAQSLPDEGSFLPEDECCDLFTYEITFYLDGGTKTVTTSDGADQPEELTAVLDGLAQLIAGSQ